MKIVAFGLGLVVASLVLTGKVWANEGLIKLSEENNSGTSCLALSVYRDGRYQVLGTCRGLSIPYSAEQTWLIIWKSNEQGVWNRLAEVERGKFSGYSTNRFTTLKVTAESDWDPRKPAGPTLASGKLETLFGEQAAVVEIEPETKITTKATPTPVEKQTTTKTAGSLLGAIGRVLGTGLLILLGAAVVMTIITKRKGF